jgi:hypothetical protein
VSSEEFAVLFFLSADFLLSDEVLLVDFLAMVGWGVILKCVRYSRTMRVTCHTFIYLIRSLCTFQSDENHFTLQFWPHVTG